MIKTTEEIMETPYKYTENKEWVGKKELLAFIKQKIHENNMCDKYDDFNDLLEYYGRIN